MSPSADVEAAVRALTDYAGLGQQALARAEAILTPLVADLCEQGFSAEDASVIGQAYIRAAWRVAAAEAELTKSISATADQAERERQLATVTQASLKLGRPLFDLLHESMLDRALRAASVSGEEGAGAARTTAVAHVDIVGSTEMISKASDREMRNLVDGLFAAVQSSVQGSGVEPTKYMGDGVFLAGADVIDVAQAALRCIASLDEQFGLRARAGLAFGAVVHRAGDMYGPPVNLANELTKWALPMTLLADTEAAKQLPPQMSVRSHTLGIEGFTEPREAYEIALPDQPAGA